MGETTALPRVRVAVGLLTYRRPDQLALNLPEIARQLQALDQSVGGSCEVIVIDNDPEMSAKDLVLGHAEAYPQIRYVSEPRPGIAVARQRCLDEVSEMDLLQFIDDDELPEPDWLSSMVRTWADWGHPAAVAGCVRPFYASTPSVFISEGGFFVRQEYPTGTSLPMARSGNLLLDLAQVRNLGLSFDTSLGLRGGEDSRFTAALVARGGRILFCAESVVLDLVPDERNQRSWVLRRAWHQGSTHSYLTVSAARPGVHRLLTRLRLAFGGSARVLVGSCRTLGGRISSSVAREAKGLRLVWRGRGILRGALGSTPPEYQRSGTG